MNFGYEHSPCGSSSRPMTSTTNRASWSSFRHSLQGYQISSFAPNINAALHGVVSSWMADGGWR
jgi:hypothetical protein